MNILTPKQVAAILQISPRQVSRLAQAEILPGFKLGSQWRFEESKIQNWITNVADLSVSPITHKIRERSAHVS